MNRTDWQYMQKNENPKKMLKIKIIVTERKNVFDGFISRVDTAKERL